MKEYKDLKGRTFMYECECGHKFWPQMDPCPCKHVNVVDPPKEVTK
jgi:hypothetical protein